jgi:proteic killer suppression protein
MLLLWGHTRSKTPSGKSLRKRPITASNRLFLPRKSHLDTAAAVAAPSHVQQILAGEFRLIGNEGKSGLGLGPHQAFDRIGGARTVVGQQHHAEHGVLGRVHRGFLQLRRHHFAQQFRGLDVDAAIDLLSALNVAKSLQDLSPLRSVGLHKLKGARKKQWAMTVNDRWRVCFEFRNGDAFDVEIVDYHKG